MSLAPLDLVSAHPWQRVVFTTYALSLSFFEAVVLDALVRGGGGSQAVILADVQGVRASLSEHGAHRVGKDYEVEPVAVSDGVFHPKVSVLSAESECHVLVGSGNLTFGGWGGNCEVLEHLHPSFAADAVADAAGFFDLMPVTSRIRHGAGEHCAAIARALRASIQGKPRNGDIRLFHNLDASISDQIAQTVMDLGGAMRMVAVAPFWDDGSAIDDLCRVVGLDHVFVHAHAHGCVEGVGASNWPRSCGATVKAVRLALINEQEPRRLHAKALEILCKRGRVVLSGSANVTTAALGLGRNVEACVVRIQRERTLGWSFIASEPPELSANIEKPEDDEQEASGVLRAILEADEVSGSVLTPKMSGAVSVFLVTSMGPELLADTTLSAEGGFRVSAPSLEERSWRGGRLVIRVCAEDGRRAEGFVSVASFGDITRRAGLLGKRLFALLAGTETPSDVAAIMSWFHEDPRRLVASEPPTIRGENRDGRPDDPERLIPVAELSHHFTDAVCTSINRKTASHQNWSRFIDHLFSGFRDKRGPFGRTNAGRTGDDEEDEGQDTAPDTAADDPAIGRSLSLFERLFELLTKDGSSSRHVVIAFDLTQYVCDRLRPEGDQVREWLERLIDVFLQAGVPTERHGDVAAAILTLLGANPSSGKHRWARTRLLRLGVDLSGEAPSGDGVQHFQSILLQQEGFPTLWTGVRQANTYGEQIASYLDALKDGKPLRGCSALRREAHEEWPVLEGALTSEQTRRRLLVLPSWSKACPRCYIALPEHEVFKLQSIGIATAKNCCRRIVIWPGV